MIFEALLTESVLSAVVGAVVSLAFSYIPKLRVKWAELSAEWQKLIMAGLLILVAVVMFGLGCLKILETGFTCDQTGVVKLVWLIFVCLSSNQTVFKLSPQPTDVKEARMSRDMG